ncbi:MAG: 5-oxoprolinase subunit PxpA [Synergistaceae bacterium]|nr:5-oxoprolinase subunit PxpA [Synergistaceae bacterium]
MHKIDLNSDLGESFGAYKLGMDSEIIKHVSSVNMACGWHAGDPIIMENTVKMCAKAGVAVGAHPSYPDLMGFGRRHMELSFEEAKACVKYQLGALMAFAASSGVKVEHLKAHGAMGNDSNKDEILARAICEAVAEVDKNIILLSFVNGAVIRKAQEMGLRFANEVFADRAYRDDCTLVPRSQPGAMIHDAEFAAKRIIRMIKEGKVETITGKVVDVSVHSVCVHGDTPTAVEIVKNLRSALTAEGVQVAKLNDFVA